MTNSEILLSEIQDLITDLRNGIDIEKNWKKFTGLIESNLENVCKSLDTRWLVSICDTYASM